MELCFEFRATPEDIRGYGFWYCFIELWPKSMKIMGLCTAISWFCTFGLLEVYFSVQLCAYD